MRSFALILFLIPITACSPRPPSKRISASSIASSSNAHAAPLPEADVKAAMNKAPIKSGAPVTTSELQQMLAGLISQKSKLTPESAQDLSASMMALIGAVLKGNLIEAGWEAGKLAITVKNLKYKTALALVVDVQVIQQLVLDLIAAVSSQDLEAISKAMTALIAQVA